MDGLENCFENIEDTEKVKLRNNIFKSISKDLSSIVWVGIVLILIIWSYIETETMVPKNAKLDIYKLSIIEEYEDSIELK